MSGDAEQDYFADGISEDIITALSKLSQLFVIARNSSFTFKGKNVNVQEVGTKPRRALCARRQRPQIRQQGAHHRAAHRRNHGRASVGGAVRSRPDRHLRRAGRRDAADRRRAGAST